MTAPDHNAARWGISVPPGHEATNTTGPDQPGLPEPDPQAVDPQWLNGLHQIKSREPAPDQLPGSPTPGSNDQCPANPAGCSQCTAQHAAVMAVVQPELDAKDAEIAQRKGDVDMLSDRITELEGDSDYWRKRAEAAEAQLRDQNGHHT